MAERQELGASLIFSVLVVLVGAFFLMLGLDFLNDFYPAVVGWGFGQCTLIYATARIVVFGLIAKPSDNI